LLNGVLFIVVVKTAESHQRRQLPEVFYSFSSFPQAAITQNSLANYIQAYSLTSLTSAPDQPLDDIGQHRYHLTDIAIYMLSSDTLICPARDININTISSPSRRHQRSPQSATISEHSFRERPSRLLLSYDRRQESTIPSSKYIILENSMAIY